MLKRVAIENLRGVRKGEVDNLSRLVVLVGPNGSGKSTILEGALIGGTRYPATAAGLAVRRRIQTWNGARWLIRGGESETAANVHVQWERGPEISRRVFWDSLLTAKTAVEQFTERGAPQPYSAFRIYRDIPAGPANAVSVTAMSASNDYLFENAESEVTLEAPFLRFVEPQSGEPLHDLFSRAVQRGHKDMLLEGAQSVVAGLKEIEILTEESNARLFLTFADRSVPATLAGDGVTAMLRIAFELAAPHRGTMLLEEPEVHQHPRSLTWCAKAIVASVRRGVQVILTTHSLELLDRLLSELSDAELSDPEFMTVVRTKLIDAELSTVAIAAKDAEAARTTLEEDLR